MTSRRFLWLLVALVQSASAVAQGVRTTSSVAAERQVQASRVERSGVDQMDAFTAQIWGLSADEVQRAKALLRGPRANFSVPNLSPIEALGIHARTEAERRKYAEMFARAQHADTERVIAWMNAYQEAMERLYPNDKVVDFSGSPKAAVDIGTADAANVPRSVIQSRRTRGQ